MAALESTLRAARRRLQERMQHREALVARGHIAVQAEDRAELELAARALGDAGERAFAAALRAQDAALAERERRREEVRREWETASKANEKAAMRRAIQKGQLADIPEEELIDWEMTLNGVTEQSAQTARRHLEEALAQRPLDEPEIVAAIALAEHVGLSEAEVTPARSALETLDRERDAERQLGKLRARLTIALEEGKDSDRVESLLNAARVYPNFKEDEQSEVERQLTAWREAEAKQEAAHSKLEGIIGRGRPTLSRPL